MKANLLRFLAAATCAAMLISAYSRTNSVTMLTKGAVAFLNSLTPEQKAKAKFAFEGEERLFWHYIPTDDIPKRYNKPRMGLILAEMNSAQRALAHSLLAAGLSQAGYIKATSIMSLEDVLRVMEKDTVGRRNPEKYHFSIFGDPSDTGTWGFRMEGHHISIHFTMVKGRLAGTPTFFGANPHEVRHGPRAGFRVLGAEEDTGRNLVDALDETQKKAAIVSAEAYKDILTEASRKAALQGQPNGLSAQKMNSKQRDLLMKILDEYVYSVPDQVAQSRLEKVRKAGNNVYFAWAGPTGKNQPHYYRIAGPTFLVEYDNTQNEANHSHTVWREIEGDFGLDLLGDHVRSSHR